MAIGTIELIRFRGFEIDIVSAKVADRSVLSASLKANCSR
jgi:hypothetical protein